MFKKDLAFGNVWEKRLLDFVEYDEAIFSKKGCKEWDVQTTYEGEVVRYEVKADRMAFQTGNIAVEFQCSNKPSGINVSTADYWAYFVVHPTNSPTLLLVPTDELRQMCADGKYHKKIRGGDGWKAEMYLFHLTDLSKYSIECSVG